MKFVELTQEEFRSFADNHPLRSYLQTPEMAELKVMDGWEKYFVGVKENNEIICATMMISYNGRMGKFFNAPRGYLIDFRNKDLLEFFTKEIKKYVKSKGGYVLKIEPKIYYKERDIDGNLVPNGFDNSDIYDNLINLGYKHGGFYEHLDLNKQVRWAFVLDISNQTEEEVFSKFKPNTRNTIRKNLKNGVSVRELAYDELAKFTEIVESSGSRKNFHSRKTEYYQKMYNLFHPKKQVKFLVTELDVDQYIEELNKERTEIIKKKDKLSDSVSTKARKAEFSSQIEVLESRIKEAQEQKLKYGKTLMMAGAMFMLYGDESVYLFSGTKSEFMTLKSQYLLQWHIIQYGIKNGYKLHNFYGINGNFSKDDDRFGVYTFKKGFGGTVVEYIGDFDLVTSPGKYYLHKIIDKFK